LKRSLILLLLFVFIDVLGFSLILPLLPFYAETFDATPTAVGLLLGANALTQLIGAPILGRLSDRYGRRPLLILSIAGTVVSFLLLGWASSLEMLFLSRILDGFLGGNISLAQAYVTDVTDEKDRARGLGFIGASFGLGFMFGPALGGRLSAGGNYGLPAFVAAALSALNLLGVLIWLPESLSPEKRVEKANGPRADFTARALFEALGRPCVGPLLIIRLFYGLAFTIFQTVFALFVDKRLGLGAEQTGYLLAYVGVLIVAIQGGGIGLLTRRFSDKQLTFGATILLTLSLLAWAFTPSVGWLPAVMAAARPFWRRAQRRHQQRTDQVRVSAGGGRHIGHRGLVGQPGARSFARGRRLPARQGQPGRPWGLGCPADGLADPLHLAAGALRARRRLPSGGAVCLMSKNSCYASRSASASRRS